jgi:hypothetical protein
MSCPPIRRVARTSLEGAVGKPSLDPLGKSWRDLRIFCFRSHVCVMKADRCSRRFLLEVTVAKRTGSSITLSYTRHRGDSQPRRG